MDNEAMGEARAKMAARIARLTLWKLRDMRRRWTRPRTYRLPKEARALKSLLAEAQAVMPEACGNRALVPAPSAKRSPITGRGRAARSRRCRP